MNRTFKRLAYVIFLLYMFLPIGAPEAQESPSGSEVPLPPVIHTREDEIIELDINTSTLMELAAWCRNLGLSEGGDRESLASRIREYFRIVRTVSALADTGETEGGAKLPKVITIESARSTEYFTLDVVNEEYARLRGDVVISLKDGDSVHRIKAWELLYNRSRNLLSATGGVEYIKESGDTIETFRGESITVDLDNWSSIFMDGISERSLSGDETTYRFAGNVISRSKEEATVLSHAEITNAGKEEAYWSLSASKLWLLPGSDFAILNGFLRVGEIPVLWIPGFFFPSDEVIFHPVMGFRSREGTFVQTTTYILGRPQSSSATESSITKILGNSSDMEKTRQGIFLRSTGKKSRDPNTTRLSVLLDYYTNLGLYAGTNLTLPAKGIFGNFDLSLGIGRTRDIQLIPGNSIYTPFPNNDGVSNWNASRIGDLDVPFRFRMTNTGSLSGKYGSFSWSLPYYSDPYVDGDFLKRSEDMDIVGMIKQGGVPSDPTEDQTSTVLGSYEWRLSGSSSLSLPRLSPYLTGISISNLTSFISFNYRNSLKHGSNSNSPNRSFYFPDKFTLYSVSMGIQGTPLSINTGTGQPAGTKATVATATEPPEQKDPLNGLGTPVPPWDSGDDETNAPPAAAVNVLFPPVLSQRFDLARNSGLRFSIAYQLSPTSASELKFRSDSSHWKELEDIDWSEVSSILTSARTDGSTTFSLSDANTIFTGTLRIAGSASLQDYSYINEEAEEFNTPAKKDAAKIRTMGQTSFTSSSEFTGTFRPFYLSTVWGNTNFQYTLKGLMAKSLLEGTSSGVVDDTYWDIIYGKWDKDSLDTHRAAVNIQASVMNKVQSLSVAADLPPEDSVLTGDAAFRAWVSETSINGKIRDPFEERIFDPLRITETLRFNSSLSVSQNVVYDPEKDEFDSLTSSLSLYGVTASFSAAYSNTYSFRAKADNSGFEWISSTEPSLNPRDLRLGYGKTFRKDGLWDKRMNFSIGLNTSLNFDLQRYTNSNFNFSLNFSLGISKFLDITLGTNSANAVIFRYFRDLPIFDVPDDLPRVGEENIFLDLINSFRFDDDRLRRDSGFKLKSFNLSLLHHLGDWNARLSMTLSPYLPTAATEYKFNTEISFVVQWLPISEIKTEINYNKEKFEFK
jgi:hypothetical protein